MKKQYWRWLMALVGLAGLAIAAQAQEVEVDHIVVTIPYEFVVAGTTLPAGSYEVRRASNRVESRILLLSSYNNRASVLLVPFEVENARNDKPRVSFERAGHQYVLSEIQTAQNVYEISTSRPSPEMLLASGKSQNDPSVSGNPGGK
jgi:hypothetical protein